MNYCGLDLCDVLNGEGFRVTLFCSGCAKMPKCKYCQNPKAWDFNYGEVFTRQTKDIIIHELTKNYISGLSILGGEPMDNLDDGVLIDLVKSVKNISPNKTVWIWTGRILEELIEDKHKELLSYIDVLIDGPYVYENKNLNNAWRGSTNQRVIDVKKTLENRNKDIILWKDIS